MNRVNPVYRVLTSRRWAQCAPIVLMILLAAAQAAARPGGGHTFSMGSSGGGGGSSSGGGSGSGSGGGSSGSDGGIFEAIISLIIELFIQLLLALIIELFKTYPQYCFPITGLLILAIVLYRVGTSRWSSNNEWSASAEFDSAQSDEEKSRPPNEPSVNKLQDWDRDGGPVELVIEPLHAQSSAGRWSRGRLREMLASDTGFSLPLFEDFVQGLYAAAHRARGQKKLANLGAYLSADARDTLEQIVSQLRDVRGVVAGSIEISQVGQDSTKLQDEVTLLIRANYTEELNDNSVSSFFTTERWVLVRKTGTLSKRHGTVQTFECPNCGGALDHAYEGCCGHCKKVIDDGSFDWVVSSIVIRERRQQDSLLEGTVQEEGTHNPTLVNPKAPKQWAEILAADSALTSENFTARVVTIFEQLQTAWSSNDWSRARAFVSDSAFESMRYWIETYQRDGLRNQVADPKLRRIELARATRDGAVDAVTIRLYASCYDYTVKIDGDELVGGSKEQRRAYTEYWTLVRASAKKGAPQAALKCPNCGAELSVSMAGECKYCHVRVVTGEHDWVLSRIEQDEAYSG